MTFWRTTMHRNQPIASVAHLACMREWGAFDRGIISPDRFKHAQPILVDVDAGAGGAQAVGTLMHAHAPAALCQRACRREAGKTGADDFSLSFAHGEVMPDLSHSCQCGPAKKQWFFRDGCV
jgi:hypothetical protein